MQEKMGRREFMTMSAMGLASLTLGSRVFGANDRIAVGVIGAGGQGQSDMRQVFAFAKELNVEVTAICDVWRLNRESAVEAVQKQFGRKPLSFVDYQDLLASKDVDAVIIATPDFHHCRMLNSAMRSGKDVYVEKPMAMFLDEAKDSLEIAKQTRAVVQVGTQRRSDGRYAAGARFVRSGALGTISRVEAAWNDCGARWKKDISNVNPDDIDWKRYLAGAKKRPFDASRFREWQLYREYCSGTAGLLGAHMIDVVHWFMGDSLPNSAVALGGRYAWKEREHEDTLYALFDYPKGFMMRYLTGLGNATASGCYFYGTNGMFDTTTWKATGVGGAGGELIRDEQVITGSAGMNHMKNFLECVRSRQTPNASIQDGYAHSVCAIMTTMSLKTGKKMIYDHEKMEIREC